MTNQKQWIKLFFIGLLGLWMTSNCFAQSRIDGAYAFQTDPAKKYSLYIPSTYSAGTPNKLMLGLHPLNTSRWDAEAWCDTLIQFAEVNNLILVCPDGGLDGRIDDAIDTAFTSNLLDSVAIWYDIDVDKTYAMGFSWGGKTTYTYGLSHAWRFRGFLPIGSAMSGTSEVSGSITNANGKPFYLVHGSSDSPSNRYTPIYNALNNNGAILNSLLMSGVGHTIDFPNRNQILKTAFEWIDSVNCSLLTTTSIPAVSNHSTSTFSVYPNPIVNNQTTLQYYSTKTEVVKIQIYDLLGNFIRSYSFPTTVGENKLMLSTEDIPAGNYFLSLNNSTKKQTTSIIIQETE
jgi:predicted esterase